MDQIRGQTPQDFAIGVSILLVTIVATFGLVQGGVFDAYDTGVDGDRQASADRVADYLVTEYSVDGARNTLGYDRGEPDDVDALRDDLAEVRERGGLNVSTDRRANPRLEVRIVNSSTLATGSRLPADPDPDPASGTDVLRWGDEFDGDPNAASATRVVHLTGETGSGGECETVCWLVVRVW